MHCFSYHMWKTYEIEPALFLMLFSISFGKSAESSNEVNCFFTDSAKILISRSYIIIYSVYFYKMYGYIKLWVPKIVGT